MRLNTSVNDLYSADIMSCFISLYHRLSDQACPNLFLIFRATLTRLIKTGTSTSGPMTVAKASPEWMPNTATATAMASSKLLLAAVKDRDVVYG